MPGSADVARVHQQALQLRGEKPSPLPGSAMAVADAWVKLQVEHRGARTPPPKLYQKFSPQRCMKANDDANSPFTAKQVQRALAAGKKGKSAGEDQISYEVLHLFDE